MEETVISEDEVPKFLAEYQIIAKQYVDKKDFKNALESLKNSEELLEAVSSQGGIIDSKFILSTLHNIAFCCYKLNRQEDCASYLDGSLFNSNSLEDSERCRKLRYQCKTNLLLSSIFRVINREEASTESAKLALTQVSELIAFCHSHCKDHIDRHMQFNSSKSLKRRMNSQRQYKLMQSPHYLHFHEQVVFALPILEFLHQKLDPSSKLTDKQSYRNLQKLSLQQFEFSFDEVDWLDYEEFSNFTGIQAEFAYKSILEKVCMAVYTLFIAGKKRVSAQIADALLPNDCKLSLTVKEGICKRVHKSWKPVSLMGKRAKTPHPTLSPANKHFSFARGKPFFRVYRQSARIKHKEFSHFSPTNNTQVFKMPPFLKSINREIDEKLVDKSMHVYDFKEKSAKRLKLKA